MLYACSHTRACRHEGASKDELRSIYVVQRGWHTGIAVAVADWPNRDWSLLKEFPEAEYLEFGWGDERFYQAERNTPWLGTRAVLWPTSSVIHVIAFDAPLGDMQANAVEVVQVSRSGLQQLTRSIEGEFAGVRPTEAGPQTRLAPSPNRFYTGKRSFYFPRMCNWWIARHLAAAGCPVEPWTIVTASQVMEKARGFGDAAPLLQGD